MTNFIKKALDFSFRSDDRLVQDPENPELFRNSNVITEKNIVSIELEDKANKLPGLKLEYVFAILGNMITTLNDEKKIVGAQEAQQNILQIIKILESNNQQNEEQHPSNSGHREKAPHTVGKDPGNKKQPGGSFPESSGSENAV